MSALTEKQQKVHEEALEAARVFKRSEAALLDALTAVEHERVYLRLGFSSLFNYAVQSLGLSEGVAYNAITVARKSQEVPALREELQQGTITLSKAKKIASVLTPENQTDWIEKAKTLPSRQLEKEVARENPKEATPERAVYVSANRLTITLGASEVLSEKLHRVQDQVSQSKGNAASLEDTLEELVDFYLKHKDPVEKAKRVTAKKEKQNPNASLGKQFPGTVGPKSAGPHKRVPIPASIAHLVRLRDQGKCHYRGPDGKTCGSRRWVDLHHIIEVSKGGPNSVENLITLCRAHHRTTHETQTGSR